MVDFTLWDIFRNLLLAARWTVVLSLIAFIGGGLVGLALLVARLARRAAWHAGGRLRAAVPGHAAADAAVPGLLRPGAVWHQDLGLGGGGAGADALHQRLPDRDLARLRGRHPQGPVGGGRKPGAELRRADALRDPAAGRCASPMRAHGGLSGAGDQGHGAGLGDRLRRADQGRHDDHQRHLQALPGLQLCGAAVLCAVLPDSACTPKRWRGQTSNVRAPERSP